MSCMSRGLKLKKCKPLKSRKWARTKRGLLYRFKREVSLDKQCLLMSLYLSCDKERHQALLNRVETPEPVWKD